MTTPSELRDDALAIFRAALDAANPYEDVVRALAREDDTLRVNGRAYDLARGRVIVIGAGKAGAPMAQAVEDRLGDKVVAGAVTVKYDHTGSTRKIKLNEAGHPLPDENGARSTREIVQLLRDLEPDDLVLCLLSGGGSALLELPVESISLDDFRALTNALLKSGATVNELNALRKHLSQVKGGGIARHAQPASVVSLILSDVLGSPLDVIASGPTAPDSSTYTEALAVIQKYELREKIPASIVAHLERGLRGEIADTPKPNDPLFARVNNIILADNSTACRAAAEAARERGYLAQILSTQMQGEARIIGESLARAAKEKTARANPLPICLLAGGEPTVTIRGHGKGGRAQELALAAARELEGAEDILLLCAGTDGTDGPTDAAGAIADGSTVERARVRGLDASEFLDNNDSYHFFQALDDLIITGPTNTNVNDLMLVLIG